MLTDDQLATMYGQAFMATDRQGASIPHFGRLVEAAATAEARALVLLALEELDDGEAHAQDCMTRYDGYPCRCTKPATVAKLRAFLAEPAKTGGA